MIPQHHYNTTSW